MLYIYIYCICMYITSIYIYIDIIVRSQFRLTQCRVAIPLGVAQILMVRSLYIVLNLRPSWATFGSWAASWQKMRKKDQWSTSTRTSIINIMCIMIWSSTSMFRCRLSRMGARYSLHLGRSDRRSFSFFVSCPTWPSTSGLYRHSCNGHCPSTSITRQGIM